MFIAAIKKLIYKLNLHVCINLTDSVLQRPQKEVEAEDQPSFVFDNYGDMPKNEGFLCKTRFTRNI